jgi:hypothetical protein
MHWTIMGGLPLIAAGATDVAPASVGGQKCPIIERS